MHTRSLSLTHTRPFRCGRHQEFCGLMKNPMSLRAFPFDTDFIEIFIHQSEASTRDDYIFRPFDVRRRRRETHEAR